MGARFTNEYVYIFDNDNIPHFVLNYYEADLNCSYRSDIYLGHKSYCVHDLPLTDEVEIEGEFLPYTHSGEWKELFCVGPSENVSTILSEAGLADVSISKVVFFRIECSARCILEHHGFVSCADGTKMFDSDFWEQAISLAKSRTDGVAEQHEIIDDWIVEQVRNGSFASL